MEATELDEDGFLVCSPMVLGSSFGDKMWREYSADSPRHTCLQSTVELAVADIRDIERSTLSFDCLVMPDAQKKMILALAETRVGRVPTLPFDDVVEEEWQGLNVLLQYELLDSSSKPWADTQLAGHQELGKA